MSHFLYKPHVEGPESNITSPDVLVDRLRVGDEMVPIQRLTQRTDLQVAERDVTLTACVAVTAVGSGPIVGCGAVLRTMGVITDVVVPRHAWRLSNISDHLDRVVLSGPTERLTLSEMPALSAAEPVRRGEMMVLEAGAEPIDGAVVLTLEDGELARTHRHRITLVSAGLEVWPGRPAARYSVGPQGDVPHYV